MPLAPAGTVKPPPVDLLLAAEAPPAGVRLRDGGNYVRVRAGVYTLSAEWTKLEPWERYLVRVHAFALRHPDAVFSHESAAALIGLPVFGEPRDIHIHDPDRTRSQRFGDVSVHTSADDRGIDERGLLRTTSLSRTAVDLMRVLPPAFRLAVADAAVSPAECGTSSLDLLRSEAEGDADRRGRARLRLLWPLVDARAESVGESVSRAVIRWSGFEEPELQVEVPSEGFRDRVDFGWPGVRALGESDGYEKYRGKDPDDTVRRVVDEKRREDRLRRCCRSFGRWDWATTLAVAPLAKKLDEMGVRRVAPSRKALLTTLGRNPRSLPPVRNHEPAEKPRHA